MISNLLHIAHGGHFHPCRYPPRFINGREIPRYPGEKIAVIKSLAKAARFMDLDTMFGEVYNKELRNAVFHSDYANDKKGLRLVSEGKSIPWDDVSQLINRGIAYFDSITNLYEGHIASYTESVVIPAPKGFSSEPDEAIRIIIREGHGAVGFRTEATEEQVACGKIIARGGRYFAEELDMLRKNPDLNVLPKRKRS